MNVVRYIVPLLFPLVCSAQETSTPKYPQNYFRNPLNIPIVLAGNFGECRSGHFHSGMDIKTQGNENMPVHAAADGYIARIKTEKGGFGHAIYIKHPNGYTTLYAHLNDFSPLLQAYLRQQQYAEKQWNLDLHFSADKFPVSKGQQIAWSGNTGGSSAPHLHFEIRDSKTEHPLNPQLFGFDIADDVAPKVKEIVFYEGNIYEKDNISVLVSQKENVYKPLKTSNVAYRVIGDTVQIPSGTLGIGINVDDYMNGSTNTITFATAQLFLDGALQSEITLDDIGYEETRYINAYVDYKTREQNKKWVQCMFLLPENRLEKLYTQLNETKGRINLNEDGIAHELKIVITDNNDNSSTVSMFLAAQPLPEIDSDANTGCIPFYHGKTNEYHDPNLSFELDSRQLYDDICFEIKSNPDKEAISDRYTLHYPYVPLHHYFDLMMKPNKTIPFAMRKKVVLMYSDGKDIDGQDAVFTDDGWYKGRVRSFGTYWLSLDTTAPFIYGRPKNGANLSKAKRISLSAKDEITSIKSYSGLIDGKWVCFEQHGNSFFYEFDEHCLKGKHELVFAAEDQNGNATTVTLSFIR